MLLSHSPCRVSGLYLSRSAKTNTYQIFSFVQGLIESGERRTPKKIGFGFGSIRKLVVERWATHIHKKSLSTGRFSLDVGVRWKLWNNRFAVVPKKKRDSSNSSDIRRLYIVYSTSHGYRNDKDGEFKTRLDGNYLWLEMWLALSVRGIGNVAKYECFLRFKCFFVLTLNLF